MKLLGRIAATIGGVFLLAIVAFLVWYASQTPTYVYRFRMVIEAEADGALRAGSSVIEVRTTDVKVGLPEAMGVRSRVRGEAVFVDLGGGRNVIATLGFGPNGSEEKVERLVVLAFRPAHPGLTFESVPQLTGSAPLTGNLIPTLVTFTDLNDPKTARVVRPDMFEQEFGPGFRFRRATLEMVSAGTWPFTWIGWPHSLAGEPVTRGIETRLPWLRPLKGYLAGPQPDLTNTRPSRNLTGNEFIKGI